MIQYVSYKDETQLETIMSLIDQELSEPYSIFTYRYFITLWPDLCFMVTLEAEVTNKGALALYGNLAFICAKCLHRYYLNSVDAFPLKLLFPRLPDPNNLFALAGVGHDHGNVHHDCMHHQHQKDQEHCAGNEYPHVGHNHHHPRWEGDYRLSTTADK